MSKDDRMRRVLTAATSLCAFALVCACGGLVTEDGLSNLVAPSSDASSGDSTTPDCVYLLGTLQEGASFRNVLIDPTRPLDRAYGFGHVRPRPLVNPTTGRLWFAASGSKNETQLHVFSQSVPTSVTSIDIQLAPQPVIPTPNCDSAVNYLYAIFAFPEDGVLAYTCAASPLLSVAGANAPDLHGRLPVAVGYERTILTFATGEGYALVKDDVVTPLPPLYLNASLSAVRARPAGGFYAVGNAPNVRGQLMEIMLDGTVTVVGPYDFGPPEPGVGPGSRCVLDGKQSLFCLNDVPGADFAHGVLRFSIGAPPVVVFDERNSDVKIHISSLATGP
jgi:hypothetical protein